MREMDCVTYGKLFLGNRRVDVHLPLIVLLLLPTCWSFSWELEYPLEANFIDLYITYSLCR